MKMYFSDLQINSKRFFAEAPKISSRNKANCSKPGVHICFSDYISGILTSLKERRPLIHCITNPISINQCANSVLATGARPIMAEHPLEVAEIASTASALMLNLGNITDVRMESMRLAAEAAVSKSIPIVFDAVGVACSVLRRTYALNFIKEFSPAVVKGNYSEITALTDLSYLSDGVDSYDGPEFDTALNAAAGLADFSGGVVLASGKTDIITDGKSVILVKNGSPMLSSITGTGCMLGALTSCFLAGASYFRAAEEPDISNESNTSDSKKSGFFMPDTDCITKILLGESPNIELSLKEYRFLSTAAASICLGVSGELAETDKGNGSFSVNLFDRLSTFDIDAVRERIKVEVIKL